MKNRIIIKIGIAAALVVLIAACSGNTSQEIPVHLAETTDEIEGASATLTRSEDGYDLVINTSGLTSGNAVTVWWVFFNTPDRCTGGVCDHNDEPSSSKLAAGQVIDDSGTVNFESSISKSGISDGAEIHFIIRDHGPAIDDILEEQTSEAGGGCNNFSPRSGPNECVDVQEGIFRPFES